MNTDSPTRTRADLHDWIQEAVIARARELDLTAYALAQRSGVSQSHVRDYLGRRASMGSHKLQHLLTALGLAIGVDAEQLPVGRGVVQVSIRDHRPAFKTRS